MAHLNIPDTSLGLVEAKYIANLVRNVRQNDTFKAVWFHENKLIHESEEVVVGGDFEAVICVWFNINSKTGTLLAGQ
jgi:hypothetical protein